MRCREENAFSGAIGREEKIPTSSCQDYWHWWITSDGDDDDKKANNISAADDDDDDDVEEEITNIEAANEVATLPAWLQNINSVVDLEVAQTSLNLWQW